MTLDEFNKFRLSVSYYYASLVHDYINKNNIGTKEYNIDNNLYVIFALAGYIMILLEYNLFSATEEDTNFFDRDTMKNIVLKINDILNTNYSIDFVLT